MKRIDFLKTITTGTYILVAPFSKAGLFTQGVTVMENPGDIKDGFINPPASAKPLIWWQWMNGNVSKEGISLDLKAMKDAGVGGFQLFHEGVFGAGPALYNSPLWHELMEYTIQEAKSLGLEVCIHNCAGWTSSGGPWITPDKSMKKIVWSEVRLEGTPGNNFTGWLKEPESLHEYYRDVAVIAFPAPKGDRNDNGAEGFAEGFRLHNWKVKSGFDWQEPGVKGYRKGNRPAPDTSVISDEELIPFQQIVDLTDKMEKDGRLTWKVPDGHWTVIRFGYTTTGAVNSPAPPEGRGLECDKLSREGSDAHWNGFVKKVIQNAGVNAGKTFKSVLIDSYEVGPQNWTGNFPKEFNSRCGYNMLPYLPCITGRVVHSIEKTERFLWDFRRVIADLFAENYYGYFAELCEQNGMELASEPYGIFGNYDEFANAGKAHMPMGEFWVNYYDIWCSWSSKLAASSAHTFGRKYAGAESFTSALKDAAWIDHPYYLKALGDYYFTQGINRMVLNDFGHQPWTNLKPGMTVGPWGCQLNRGNTWWEQSTAWMSYITRCQHLLQSGQFVADLCYYFGENVPNTLVREEKLQPAPPAGIDYDVFATDVLMQLKVVNGKFILPSGMEYHVMVLPHFERIMRIEVLRKIGELVKAGGTIVGPKPLQSPGLVNYPESDNQLKALAEKIWGNINGKTKTSNTYGRGRVYWGVRLEKVFSELNIQPDFTYADNLDLKIEYIHRRTGDDDIYFISNQRHCFENLECSFRIVGKTPEKWDPETGNTRKIAVYRERNGRTEISLSLSPAESVFVVFRKPASNFKHIVEAQYNDQSIFNTSDQVQPVLKITQANYGVLGDASKTIDVTSRLAELTKHGQLQIVPKFELASDPSPGNDKQLYVEYQVGNSHSLSVTVKDNARLIIPDQPYVSVFPAGELVQKDKGSVELQAWRAGRYKFLLSDGSERQIQLDSIPAPQELNGPWDVAFPPGWGAPEKTTFNKLLSWSEHTHTDIKHFSGTAVYKKQLEVSAELIAQDHLLWLDLGKVYVIAEVIVNGKNLGICWKPPFRVNVSGIIKAGNNQLEIRITNLWPNRLIGDEAKPALLSFEEKEGWLQPKNWDYLLELAEQQQQTGRYTKETGRYTFTTWKIYNAGDPLLDSGLVGPVKLHVQVVRELKM